MMQIRWGLSVKDRHSHAIDKGAEHPADAYRALCGHTLLIATLLYDQPHHTPCKACARQLPDGDLRAGMRSAPEQVLALAEQAPRLTNQELRAALEALQALLAPQAGPAP